MPRCGHAHGRCRSALGAHSAVIVEGWRASKQRSERSSWPTRPSHAPTSRLRWPTCRPPSGASRPRTRSCRAAMACVRLGDTLANAMGNLTASRAWFARARRLVEDQPPCLEQGWVAVAAMGCDVDDPAELLAAAELALDRARRFGDVNLETKALADAGLAHVQAGRVSGGDGAARRGDGAGVRSGRRHVDGRQVGLLVLHRLLPHRRLRPGGVVGRTCSASTG